MPVPIHIDGSLGEGGGQILRTALALAALLRQPVEIDKIRANRTQPGLKTQHLAGVLALADITAAEVKGAHKHSTSLSFLPRTIKGGKYRFDISTAGAACMLFSAVLPPLLFAAQTSEITITGGTHVPFSPPFHYLADIFLPALRKMGAEVELKLVRWGFYPKGGGEIRANIKPCRKLRMVQLQRRGVLKELKLSAYSANLPDHIAHREIGHVKKSLEAYSENLRTHPAACHALSPGNFIFLEADYEHVNAGFSGLGKRGRPAEEVADEVCRAFRDFDGTGATLDSHLADQLILYMAMAHGDSFFTTDKVTSHLTTNVDIVRRFLPVSVKVDSASGKAQVTGAGLTPEQ
jgi:RNA 3'-phosphate cyclase